jgi:hypothetical protein
MHADLAASSGVLPAIAVAVLAARPVVRYLVLLVGLFRVLNGSHRHDRPALFADFTTACRPSAASLQRTRTSDAPTPPRRPAGP